MLKAYLFLPLLAFLLMLTPNGIFASPQMPDYIIYKNDTIVTYNLLVEKYLQNHETVQPDQLFGLSFRNGAVTTCWRGYQAIYKIDNDSLFVINIISCGEGREGKIDLDASARRMEYIFKDKVVNDRVYIDWFSGDISFPLNNKVLRWDGVFYTTYERETLISVLNGKILNVADIDNYEDNPNAIDRQDRNKISDILFSQLKKVRWENTDKFDCSETYLVTINKDGKVSKVIMPEYPTQDSIDKYWDKEEYNYCINNVLKALRKLKFDVIKSKGKPIAEDIFIEIFFDDKNKIENWTNH